MSLVMKNDAIADIREYPQSLYELLDRYVAGGVVFPDTRISRITKGKWVNRILMASSIGVPLPSATFVELQSGKWLAIDASGRLRSVLSYMAEDYVVAVEGLLVGKEEQELCFFSQLPPRMKRDVKTTYVSAKLIGYETPAYMQLYIAGYMENLTIAYLEAVRREVYNGKGMEIIRDVIENRGWNRTYTSREYDFIVFMTYMVNYVTYQYDGDNIGQYKLQDRMFRWIKGHKRYVEEMFTVFDELYSGIVAYPTQNASDLNDFEKRYTNFVPGIGHVCGIAGVLYEYFDREFSIRRLISEVISKTLPKYPRKKTEVGYLIEESDLSYRSLKRIINVLFKEMS